MIFLRKFYCFFCFIILLFLFFYAEGNFFKKKFSSRTLFQKFLVNGINGFL
jgi:hypothetical protein